MGERTPKRGRKLLAALGAGMGIAYFFDPRLGRTRRAKARDQIKAAGRHGARRLGRWGRRMSAGTHGRWMQITHRSEAPKDFDDVTLAHKVESEVLRHDAHGITVNAEDGVVILRGEVDSPERMAKLANAVLKVPGVVGVENLLHLPGEPAPNKAKALEASARASQANAS
jgi:hypothetical protein